MKPVDPSYVHDVVTEFLRERFDIPVSRITDDTSIRELGLDSMMMLEVMLELEDRLGVKLSDLSMPADPTLRSVIELVGRNQATKPDEG